MERSKNFNRRKIIGLGVLGTVGAVYLRDYLSKLRKITPVWEYRSYPTHPLNWDRVVRVVTNPLMKLVADGIVSHSWDWAAIEDKEGYSQKWLLPMKDRWYEKYGENDLTILHYMLAHTIIGVQDAYVIGLDREKLKKQQEKPEGYHYSFQVEGDKGITKNKILIPTNEKIRILISTKPLRILALDSQDNELPVVVEGPIERRDKRYKHLRLF